MNYFSPASFCCSRLFWDMFPLPQSICLEEMNNPVPVFNKTFAAGASRAVRSPRGPSQTLHLPCCASPKAPSLDAVP